MLPDALQVYRAELASAVAIDCTSAEPELKRIPRGADADAPEAAHLRYKSVIARTMDQKPVPTWLSSSDAVLRTVALVEGMVPLNRWIYATLTI